jgi:hypothetical protein
MAAAFVSQPVGPEFESSAATIMKYFKIINTLFYKSNIYLNLTRHPPSSHLPENE